MLVYDTQRIQKICGDWHLSSCSKRQLGHSRPSWCLGSSPGSPPSSSFLLIHAMGGSR